MDSTGMQPECSSGVLVVIDSQPTSPKLDRNPIWFLSCYIQDHNGNTQLHRYMINLPENKDLIQRLIDVTWPLSLLDIRNAEGMTALHVCAKGNESDIVRQLLVAGANPMSKDNFGYTPLHIASAQGDVDMVIALTKTFDKQEESKMKLKNLKILDLSSSLHEQNNAGETPLHVATENEHLDIVKLLLELGANIDCIRFRDGRPPLHIAIMKCHKEITELILDHHRETSNYMSYYHYWCPELILPLQLMGLDEKFIEMCTIPLDRIYPQNSYDNLGRKGRQAQTT